MCDFDPVNRYDYHMLSRTVSQLWRSIGQIITFDEMPLFNTIVLTTKFGVKKLVITHMVRQICLYLDG